MSCKFKVGDKVRCLKDETMYVNGFSQRIETSVFSEGEKSVVNKINEELGFFTVGKSETYWRAPNDWELVVEEDIECNHCGEVVPSNLPEKYGRFNFCKRDCTLQYLFVRKEIQ